MASLNSIVSHSLFIFSFNSISQKKNNIIYTLSFSCKERKREMSDKTKK